MTSLTSALPSSGDGKQGNPQQFLFLMTDGVQDVPGNCGYGHCTQAFDPSWCNDLKSKQHVTIGVIYTTYLAMPWRAEYRDLVQPFADSLVPNLTSCASPGWFYQASDANDIQVILHDGTKLKAEVVGKDGLPGIGLSRSFLDDLLVREARSAGAEVFEGRQRP